MFFIKQKQISVFPLLSPLNYILNSEIFALVILSVRYRILYLLQKLKKVLLNKYWTLTPLGLLFVVIRILGVVKFLK